MSARCDDCGSRWDEHLCPDTAAALAEERQCLLDRVDELAHQVHHERERGDVARDRLRRVIAIARWHRGRAQGLEEYASQKLRELQACVGLGAGRSHASTPPPTDPQPGARARRRIG